jgi:hypothetical protein
MTISRFHTVLATAKSYFADHGRTNKRANRRAKMQGRSLRDRSGSSPRRRSPPRTRSRGRSRRSANTRYRSASAIRFSLSLSKKSSLSYWLCVGQKIRIRRAKEAQEGQHRRIRSGHVRVEQAQKQGSSPPFGGQDGAHILYAVSASISFYSH